MKPMAGVLVIQTKGRVGRPTTSSLGCCFFSYMVALHRGDTSAYRKIGRSQENWPRVPWDISSSCSPWCGLGAWYQESLQREMVSFLSEAIMCWDSAAELTCLALMPFREPSFRQIRIENKRDLSAGNCPPSLFSLRQNCFCGIGNMCSHKIAVPTKSLRTQEKKINLLFSSLTTPFLHVSFLINFHVQWYKFSGSVLSVCVCVCVCVWKRDGILVEPLEISLLATVALPFPSYYPAIHPSSGHLTLLPTLCSCLPCGKKETNVSNKNNAGFLVLMHDARVTVRKLEPSAKPRLDTGGKAALLPGASRTPKWKSPASAAWDELCGWKQRQMHIICGSGREGDS